MEFKVHHRSINGICIFATRKLNLHAPRNWTRSEDNILKQYYSTEGSEVYKRLPGRNRQSCISRANKFGLKYEVAIWTEEENQLYKTLYFSKSCAELLQYFPNRTVSAIKNHAHELGLVKNEWSEADLDFLVNNTNRLTYKELCVALPHKTPSSIQAKVKSMNLTPALDAKFRQAKLLKDKIIQLALTKKYSNAEIATMTNCSRANVTRTLKEANIQLENSCLKQVICIETQEVFNSLKAAVDEYGPSVASCVAGYCKTAYGYHWKYIEEE